MLNRNAVLAVLFIAVTSLVGVRACDENQPIQTSYAPVTVDNSGVAVNNRDVTVNDENGLLVSNEPRQFVNDDDRRMPVMNRYDNEFVDYYSNNNWVQGMDQSEAATIGKPSVVYRVSRDLGW